MPEAKLKAQRRKDERWMEGYAGEAEEEMKWIRGRRGGRAP